MRRMTFALHYLEKANKMNLTAADWGCFVPSHSWIIKLHWFPPRYFKDWACVNKWGPEYVEEDAFAPLVVVFDIHRAEARLACFSIHLCLCVHMRRNQSVYFLPHTAILVFNGTFQGEPFLPWLKHKFLMNSHTRAIEMCPLPPIPLPLQLLHIY